MPRKRYETPEDLAKQEEVMDSISKAWTDKVVHLPKSYQLDCVGIDDVSGEVEWFGEIKCRSHSSTKYPDLIISLLKMERGRTLIGGTGDRFSPEFYIFVKFEDKLMAHRCDFTQHYKVTYGGRTLNTRDPEDIEPVVHIPMHRFFEICPPVKVS